jgi:hypothetical protein
VTPSVTVITLAHLGTAGVAPPFPLLAIVVIPAIYLLWRRRQVLGGGIEVPR